MYNNRFVFLNKLYVLYFLAFFLCCKSNSSVKNELDKKQDTSLVNQTNTIPFTYLIVDNDSILMNGRTLEFYYHDSLGFGYPVTVSTKITKILINSPVLLYEANRMQVPYLIYPGEHIIIKKQKDNYSSFSISNNIQRSNELHFFEELVKKTGSIHYSFPPPKYITKATGLNQFLEYENDINLVKENRTRFLDSFSTKLNVSSDFFAIAKNVILMTAIEDSILLLKKNTYLFSEKDKYIGSARRIVKTINETKYYPFLPYLTASLLSVSLYATNGSAFQAEDSLQFKNSYDFVMTNYSGMVKNFLLTRIIYSGIRNRIPILNRYLQNFEIDCTDSGYKKMIALKLLNEKDVVDAKGSNLLFSINDEKTQDIKDVFSIYRGKLILLDFWASWCSPCRAEMPASARLRKEYEGKPVEFIYISTDENKRAWLNANKEENLDNATSFLYLNSADAPFTKQYKIKTIPRYMLIGKDGKIINSDAPRPSDPKLKELIDKYLK